MLPSSPARAAGPARQTSLSRKEQPPVLTPAREWNYLYVMRAGAFERHVRSCDACRGAYDTAPGGGTCDEAMRLAIATDAAKEHVEQLDDEEIWSQVTSRPRG